MRTHTRAIFVLFISALLNILPCSSHANERPVFDNDTLLKSQILNLSKMLEQPITHYDVARIDLNGDGLDDYIAKSQTCDHETLFCIYHVFGENGAALSEIGSFQAKDVIVAHDTSYGIHDLYVYQNELNDYDHVIYRWVPAQSRYILVSENGNTPKQGAMGTQ